MMCYSRIITLLLTLLIFGTTVFSQANTQLKQYRPSNSISINLLVDASLISLNYERLLTIGQSVLYTGKIGLGYNEEFNLCLYSSCGTSRSYLTVPHHFSALFGKSRHFLELGLGGTIILGDTTQPYFLYPIVGFRFLPLKSNKVNYRIYGQWPILMDETDDILFVPIGISLGISFD